MTQKSGRHKLTILEIEAKKTTLEGELSTALEAAKVLTPATVEFDEAYGRYLAAKTALARIPDEVAKAKQVENADAIAQCAVQTGEALTQLLAGLKVADLLGTPVIAGRWAIDAEGKMLVVFNPITKVSSSTGSKKTGTGRTTILDTGGNVLSLTKFVLAHATEAEKTSDAFKYPHTQVATKPKFEAFCTEHKLTGYTYQLPEDAPVTPAPAPAPAPVAVPPAPEVPATPPAK